MSRSRTTRLLASGLLAALVLPACGRDEERPPGIEVYRGTLARLDGEPVTVDDVRPDVAFQIYQRQVDVYSLLKAETERLVDERLLAREAARRGASVDEMLRHEVEARAAPATEADVDAYLAEHPESASEPEARARVRHYLTETRRIERRLELLDRLRAQAGYTFLLEPPEQPRVRIATDGAPSRGAPDAPVTLVHFATFSSPLSARSAGYLERLVQEFPGRLRWVHRHYLNDHDETGLLAAEVAVAAAEAGRFWDFHDRLFALEGRLTAADVERVAAEVGLDEAARRAAAVEPRYLDAVKRDLDAGNRAAVKREPVIFVNGLYFSGTFPYERVRALVEKELGHGAEPRRPRPPGGR